MMCWIPSRLNSSPLFPFLVLCLSISPPLLPPVFIVLTVKSGRSLCGCMRMSDSSCRASGGWEGDNDLSTYITVQSSQGVQMCCTENSQALRSVPKHASTRWNAECKSSLAWLIFWLTPVAKPHTQNHKRMGSKCLKHSKNDFLWAERAKICIQAKIRAVAFVSSGRSSTRGVFKRVQEQQRNRLRSKWFYK